MMYEPVPPVVEELNKTHAKRVYAAAANSNIPHTKWMDSKITGINNVVEEVIAFTKESEEEDSDVEKDVNSDDADEYDDDDDLPSLISR